MEDRFINKDGRKIEKDWWLGVRVARKDFVYMYEIVK